MQEHERWIEVAEIDLKTARVVLPSELFTSVVYHCQQAAEKALKAYMIFKGHEVTKIHDLIKLLELCMLFDKDFGSKFDEVDFLNPFSVKFRYPTEFEIPDKNDAELAVRYAERVMKFVIKKFSDPKTGQSNILDVK